MQVVVQLLYKLRNQSFLYRRGGKGVVGGREWWGEGSGGGKGVVGWGKRNIIKPYGCSGKFY